MTPEELKKMAEKMGVPSYGGGKGAATTSGTSPSAATPATPSTRDPSIPAGDDEESTLASVVKAPFRAARGVLKGGLRAGMMINDFLPSFDFTEEEKQNRLKGREMLDRLTAGSPDEGWAEWGGRQIGESLPYAAIPELGLGAKGAQLAGKLYTPIRGAAGQFARRPGVLAGMARQAAPYLAGKTGQALERAGVGAAVGAAQDPESRGRGALAGAAGALAPGTISGATKFPAVQKAGAWLGQHAVIGQALHLAALPWWAVAGIIWHRSPVGHNLYLQGQNVVNKAGELIGRVPPQLSAAMAAWMARGTLGESGGTLPYEAQDGQAPQDEDDYQRASREQNAAAGRSR